MYTFALEMCLLYFVSLNWAKWIARFNQILWDLASEQHLVRFPNQLATGSGFGNLTKQHHTRKAVSVKGMISRSPTFSKPNIFSRQSQWVNFLVPSFSSLRPHSWHLGSQFYSFFFSFFIFETLTSWWRAIQANARIIKATNQVTGPPCKKRIKKRKKENEKINDNQGCKD